MLNTILNLVKNTFFNKVDDTSKPNKVDVTDIAKILRDGGIMAVVAFLTFLVDNVGLIDFGEHSVLVVTVVTAIAQFARKFLTDNGKDNEKVNE